MFEQHVMLGQRTEIGMIDQEHGQGLIHALWPGLNDRLVQHPAFQAEGDHQHHRPLERVRLFADQRSTARGGRFRRSGIRCVCLGSAFPACAHQGDQG